MNSPVRLGVSSAATSTLIGVFSQRLWGFIFPLLEPWVLRSISFPSCSSQFICMGTWDHPVWKPPPHLLGQPLPSCQSSPPGYVSPPLLLFWMNVSSLTPWLSDFHTVWFSVSSGCFLFLKLMLSYFVVRGGTACLPTPSFWPEVHRCLLNKFLALYVGQLIIWTRFII